jgi:AcrR family transcriptional regulator
VIRDFRRDQVVEAARELFGDRGSLDVSMADIADAAGVSRSTVYNYFSTRDELLAACLHEGQTKLLESIKSAVDGASSPVGQLAALIEACVAHVDRSPAFYRLMTNRSVAVASTTEAASSIELTLTGLQVSETLSAILAGGARSGAFAVDVDAAFRLVGAVIGGLLQQRSTTNERTPAEVAGEVAQLLNDGFGTRSRARSATRRKDT